VTYSIVDVLLIQILEKVAELIVSASRPLLTYRAECEQHCINFEQHPSFSPR
jgi:hypothetical protein